MADTTLVRDTLAASPARETRGAGPRGSRMDGTDYADTAQPMERADQEAEPVLQVIQPPSASQAPVGLSNANAAPAGVGQGKTTATRSSGRQRRSKSVAKIASSLQLQHGGTRLVDSRIELAPLEEHLLARDEPPPARIYAHHHFSRSYSLPKLNIGSLRFDGSMDESAKQHAASLIGGFKGFNGPVAGSDLPVNLAPQEPGLSPQLDAWVEDDLNKAVKKRTGHAMSAASTAAATDVHKHMHNQHRHASTSEEEQHQHHEIALGVVNDDEGHTRDVDGGDGNIDDGSVRGHGHGHGERPTTSDSGVGGRSGKQKTSLMGRHIDRSSLKTLGLSDKSIDRLYRGLLAHRSSLRSLFHRELVKASHLNAEKSALDIYGPLLDTVSDMFSGADMIPGRHTSLSSGDGTNNVFSGGEFESISGRMDTVDVSADAENLRLLIENKGAWELRFRSLQDQIEEQKTYKEAMRDRVNALMLELSSVEDQSNHMQAKFKAEMGSTREQLQFALHAKRAVEEVLTERKNDLLLEQEAHTKTRNEVDAGLAREKQAEFEKEALSRRLASLAADKDALNKFLERLKAEMSVEREKLSQRQAEMDAFQADLDAKLESFSSLEHDREVAKKLYDEETRRCARLESNLGNLKENVSKLERSIDGRDAEIERLKNNNTHKADVIAKLNRQLEDHDALQALVDGFRSKEASDVAEHEEWRRQVCLEQMRCEEEAAACLALVKEQAAKVASLQQEVKSQEARLLRGRKENETGLKQILDMRNALTTALERTADAEQKLDLTHDAMARVEAEKAELSDNLKSAQQSIVSNEKRIESLKKQLVDITQALEHQKKKTSSTMSDLVEARRLAAAAQDDFNAKTTMANKKLDIASKRIASLEKVREELIPLRQEHAKLLQQNHDLLLSESSLTSQLEQKVKTITMLEEDKAKMTDEIDALTSQVASLEKSLRVTEHELSAKCDMEQLLTTRNKQLDDALKKANANIAELVKDRERLQESLMNESHNVRRLTTELESRTDELSGVNAELRASEDTADKLRASEADLRNLMAESLKTAEDDRKKLEKAKYELEVDINHLLETISTRKYFMNEEANKTVQRIKDDIIKSNSAAMGADGGENADGLSAHDKMKLIAKEARRREEEARSDALTRLAAHRFKSATELLVLREKAAKMDSMTKHQIKEAMAEFQGKLTSVEARLEKAMTEAEKVPVLEAQVGTLKMENQTLADKLEMTETEAHRYKETITLELKKNELELNNTRRQARDLNASLRLKERFAAGLVGRNKEVTLQNIKLGKCPETANFACQVSYADMSVSKEIDMLLTKDMRNNWLPVVLPKAMALVVQQQQQQRGDQMGELQHGHHNENRSAQTSQGDVSMADGRDEYVSGGVLAAAHQHQHQQQRHIQSAKVTMKIIQAIYTEKLKSDSVAQRQHKQLLPMSPFVWTFFFHRYGLNRAAEHALVDFVGGVLANCEASADIAKFGRMCLILQDDMDNASGQLATATSVPVPVSALGMSSRNNVHTDAMTTSDAAETGAATEIAGLPGAGARGAFSYEDVDSMLAPTTIEDMLSRGSMRDSSLLNLRHLEQRTATTHITSENTVNVDVLPASVRRNPARTHQALRHATVKDAHLLNLRHNQMGSALSVHLAEYRDKIMLTSLPAAALQHPLVEEATAVFVHAAGVESVLAQLESEHFERMMRNLDIGLPIDDDQLPQLHFLLEEAADLLHMNKPLLYVRPDTRADAFVVATGMREPVVVLTSGAVDLLTPMELQALLAMQLSNLRNTEHHAPATASALMRIAPECFLQMDGVRRDWLHGLRLSVERWEKFAQLSGDRSAMLVSQSYEYVAGAIFKLASGSHVLAGQLSVNVLIEHLQQLEDAHINENVAAGIEAMGGGNGYDLAALNQQTKGVVSGVASGVGSLVSDNSFALLRARELRKFVDSEYRTLTDVRGGEYGTDEHDLDHAPGMQGGGARAFRRSAKKTFEPKVAQEDPPTPQEHDQSGSPKMMRMMEPLPEEEFSYSDVSSDAF